MKYFRKSALIFIAIVALLAAAWVYILRNGIIEHTARTALERMFEAPVEIKGLVLNPFTLKAGFQRLKIANADHPDRWLIDAGPATFDVNIVQLLGKKLIVREVSLEDVRLGDERPEGKGVPPRPKPAPAPPAPPPPPPAKGDAGKGGGKAAPPPEDEEPGFLAGLMPDVDLSAISKEVSVDKLMQGRKLGSVEAVNQAKDQANGRIKAMQDRISNTTVPQDLRSVERDAQALRFNVKSPDDVKEIQSNLASLKKRLDASQKEVKEMSTGWKTDQAAIKGGWDAVGKAAEEDLKTLREAAKLPNLDASQIGKAVFGAAAIEQFNSMLGYARVAQKALKSDSAKTETTPRRSGRWIAYPITARVYPGFALERSVFSGALSNKQGQASTKFSGKMLGLASDQKVYGAPLTINWDGTTDNGRHWIADALFDQREAPTKTSIVIRGTGISMGTIVLSDKKDSVYPQHLAIPQADVELAFKLTGNQLGGGLSVVAHKVAFQFAGDPGKDELSTAMRTLFADFENVELKGVLAGTLSKPKFDLSTSIDNIISARLKGLVGKKVAEIDRQIRAAIAAQLDPIKAQALQAVAQQQAKLDQALGEMDQRQKQVQQTLEQRQMQAEVELKKAGDKAKKDAEAGIKKAIEDKAKGIKLPKR